jgi:hypothetical protein
MNETEKALKNLVELVGLNDVAERLKDAPNDGDFDFPNQGCSIGNLKPILAEYRRLQLKSSDK